MAAGRDLKYRSIREAAADLRILKNASLRTNSGWTLYQAVRHLTEYLDRSMTGFACQHPWIIRRSVGYLFHLLHKKNGYPANPSVHTPDYPESGDTESALNELEQTVLRFEYHEGSLAEHPFYGRMSYEDWHLWHLWHMQKHISLLNPSETEPEKVYFVKNLPSVRSTERSSARRSSHRHKKKKHD